MYKIIIDFLIDLVFGDTGASTAEGLFQMTSQGGLAMTLSIDVFLEQMGLNFSKVSIVIYSFAFYLIILKFIKKLLDVYALQTDGDPNADIVVLLTNFCKAIVIAMTFTILWSWLFQVVYDFAGQLTGSLLSGQADGVVQAAGSGLSAGDFFQAAKAQISSETDPGNLTLILIFCGLAAILMLVMLGNGVQLWILRLGVPLACCGLLDADQGVFGQYMKMIWKTVLTVLVQQFLLSLGMIVAMLCMRACTSGFTMQNLIFGPGANGTAVCLGCIACLIIVYAFFVPKLFGDLLLQKQSGGRGMQMVYMGSILMRGVL